MKKLWIPVGHFAAEDPAALQRAEIARRLRNNEEVAVAPSGELEQVNPNDDSVSLKVPKGELA